MSETFKFQTSFFWRNPGKFCSKALPDNSTALYTLIEDVSHASTQNWAGNATKTVTCLMLELQEMLSPEPKLHVRVRVLSTVSPFFVNSGQSAFFQGKILCFCFITLHLVRHTCLHLALYCKISKVTVSQAQLYICCPITLVKTVTLKAFAIVKQPW